MGEVNGPAAGPVLKPECNQLRLEEAAGLRAPVCQSAQSALPGCKPRVTPS